MENTYISLDMIFLNEELEVIGIIANVPPLSKETKSIGLASKYVVELNSDAANNFGISVGSRLLPLSPMPLAKE